MKIQINDEVRNATNEEIAAYQEHNLEIQQLKEANSKKYEAIRQKLLILGLTEDDLKVMGLA